MPSKDKVFLVIILFLCGSVLFRNLDALSVRMWDESRNAINALEMIRSGNPLVVSYEGSPDLWNTKPPFLAWNMAVCMKLFGVNEFSVRLPSVMAALVAMMAAFFLVYRVSGGNILAAIAPLALATFPGFIDYHVARNGDFDAMLSLWVFLAGIFFFRWIHDEPGRHSMIWLAALCVAGGMLTKSIAALMVLPGFAVYALLSGKIKKVFTTPQVYLAALVALVPVASFYFVREMMEPGYVASVLENELTGRYLNVSEEHAADFWFYFRALVESRLGTWKFILPIAILAVLIAGRGKPAGRMAGFGLVSALTFLLVVSSAKTKLPWYDAPVFPFLSLVCAGGIILIWERAERSLLKKHNSGIFIFRVTLCLALVAHPFYRIHAKTSVRATREQTYPELYYGDMIHAFFKSYPGERLTVVYDGYNSHALFYVRAYEWKGHYIRAATSGDRFVTGENLLFCEPGVYANVLKRYKLVPVFESDGRVLATVASAKTGVIPSAMEKAEQLVAGKIREILANAEWKKSIEEKAAANKRGFELQLRLDAIYVLQSDGILSGAEAAALGDQGR